MKAAFVCWLYNWVSFIFQAIEINFCSRENYFNLKLNFQKNFHYSKFKRLQSIEAASLFPFLTFSFPQKFLFFLSFSF